MITKNHNKRMVFHTHGLTILPIAIYRFNTILIIIPIQFFIDTDKLMLNFIQKHRRPSIAKIILNNKIAGHSNAIFEVILQGFVIKTTWYWHNNRSGNPWNRAEVPHVGPHYFSHLIFDKRPMTHVRENSIFNKSAGQTKQLYVEE